MSLKKLSKEKRSWIKDTAKKAVKYASTMDGEEAVKQAITEEDMGAGESRLVCQIFNNFRTIDQFEKGSSLDDKLGGPDAVDFRVINSDLFTPEQRKEAVDKNRNKIATDWYEKNASAEKLLTKPLMSKAASTEEERVEDHSRSSVFSKSSSVGEEAINEYEKNASIEKLSYKVESLESDILRKRAIMDDLMLEFNAAISKAAEALSGCDFSKIESRVKTDLGSEAGVVMDKVANEVNPDRRGGSLDRIVINNYEEEPYSQIKEAVDILEGMSEGKTVIDEMEQQIKEAGLSLLKVSNYDRGTMNWLERHEAIELKGSDSSLQLGESFLSDKEASLGLTNPFKHADISEGLSKMDRRARLAIANSGEFGEGLDVDELEGDVDAEDIPPGFTIKNEKQREQIERDNARNRKARVEGKSVDTNKGESLFESQRKTEERANETPSLGSSKNYTDPIADVSVGGALKSLASAPILGLKGVVSEKLKNKSRGDNLTDEEKKDKLEEEVKLMELKDKKKTLKDKSKKFTGLLSGATKAIPGAVNKMHDKAISSAREIRDFVGEDLPDNYTGLDAEFEDQLRKIQLTDFVNRLRADDTIEGYTDREVAEVVNLLIETEPGIVMKPGLGISTVKKMLENRYMEPMEMAELINKAKEDQND